MTLSSTESEYVSYSNHCQEVKFQQMLLDEITTGVRPAWIYEDNTGCIFLVKNQQAGARTKHIDVRHHFVRNELATNAMKIMFVRSAGNVADIMTKNVSEKIFNSHVPSLLDGTLDLCKEEDETSFLVNEESMDRPSA